MLRTALRKLAAPAAAAAGVATAGGAVHAQEERRRPAARCSAAAASPAEAAIPLWQTAANLVAANPFKSVFGVAAPLYAAIFAYECSSPATKDLPLSQRLIHTRVYGQAIAIGATIAVMAILNAQEKRGGLPYGQTEAKPKQSELTRLYDGTMRRASGSSSLPQGLHDRQAWAADNVDNYGLKMEQVIVPLLYMPAFPLTFILLRSRVRPETLNKVMASMIAIAASHAAWIQFGAALLLG